MLSKQEVRTWHRPLLVLTGLAIVQLVISLGGLLVDDRVLIGDPIWQKPFKFAVSIAVYGATLAWMISLLRRGKRIAWWMGTITSVMLAIEMVVIVMQTVRGVPSHFNNNPGLDRALWDLMSYAIVVLWVSNLVVAILLLRQRVVDAPMMWAIRLGVVVALVGMAVAFFMPPPTPEQLELLRNDIDPAMMGGHSVGVADGGPGMPVTGWSTIGGDLRIPHFIGLHAMQALPLLALFLRRRFTDERTRTHLVVVGGVFHAGLLGLTLWQALRGQSLINPDGWTLGALAVLVIGSAAAWASTTRTGQREEVRV